MPALGAQHPPAIIERSDRFDAKLNFSFSPQEIIELKAIAGRTEYLVGVTAQTKLAEAEGGRIDINDPRSVNGLKTRQTTNGLHGSGADVQSL